MAKRSILNDPGGLAEAAAGTLDIAQRQRQGAARGESGIQPDRSKLHRAHASIRGLQRRACVAHQLRQCRLLQPRQTRHAAGLAAFGIQRGRGKGVVAGTMSNIFSMLKTNPTIRLMNMLSHVLFLNRTFQLIFIVSPPFI